MFAGSVAKGKADPGETVRVEAATGRFLAWGAYSGSSLIRVRAWSFTEAERIDRAFFERRIARAVALRARLPIASNGVRLVHGEADGLPGLVVDRYGDTLSAQFLRRRHRALEGHCWPTCCCRPAAPRGCTNAPTPACAASKAWSRAPAGCAATGDTEHHASPNTAGSSRSTWPQGHKTGFYLDQRDNRALLRALGAAASAAGGCSTATATPAASRWRRWPAAPRR